jgi:hypothetical protein
VEAGAAARDVVLDRDRDPVAHRHQRHERQVVPAEVDGERDAAGDRVHPAGDADADRGEVGLRASAQRERRLDRLG